MGNWNICVQGVGAHHNPDNPLDAEKMAIDFVNKLKGAGHMIFSATFTYGGAENITPMPTKTPKDPC